MGQRLTTNTILREMGAMNPPQQKALISSASFLGSGLPVYNAGDVVANVNAYVTADDVYSIVRRIARTAAAVERTVYIIKDDKALAKWETYRRSVKSFGSKELLKEYRLRHKALEEAPAGNELSNLLDNPNPVYGKNEFYEGAYTFRLLTGNTFIYTPKLEFGINAGRPTEMWLVPSQYTSLQVSDTWPRRILGYKLMMGRLIEIPAPEMMQIRYFNPLYNYTGNELLGLSPITAASKVVTRQEAETDYSVNAFQNGGISGIVSNKNMSADEIEAGALGKLKSDFYNEAAGTQNARKLLFQVGDIAYTAIGLSPVDMNVLASEIRTFKKLCNVYNVSDRLFNNDATGSEISDDNARKALYTNAALPECYALDDAINKNITPAFNTKGVRYYVCTEIDDIPELQEDLSKMASALAALPIMIPNFIAEKFGMGESTDPNMSAVYIKSGYAKLDDLTSVDPIDQITDEGN